MKMVPPAGFKPTTSWFEARHSIQLSYGGGMSIVLLESDIVQAFFVCDSGKPSSAQLSYGGGSSIVPFFRYFGQAFRLTHQIIPC